MVFDQHSSALGQLASAIRFEVGTEVGAEFVRRGAQLFSYAIRRGSNGLRIRRVVARIEFTKRSKSWLVI